MPYNILLVDDDKSFRSEFRDFFDDYAIVEASNGEQALELLKRPNEIDLVILDVMMPGIRGTKVLQEIKRKYPELNIVILTGYSSKDVAVEALKGKADDYLEKPLNIDKTKEIIENLLNSKDVLSAGKNGIEGKIERAKCFAERNYHKKLRLKDTAETICLSPKYLSRIFRQTTGMGFSDYKLDIKIKKAKELLRRTEYNIDQISEKMGYQNSESFIRIFKKLTGATPTQYRKDGRSEK
jgi:two-component system, response regulator YesN